MKNVVVLLIALSMAFMVTIPKLYKMCQIKGFVPGARITQETVTQKWNERRAKRAVDRDTYWIAWSDVNIQKVGDHRVNVPLEYWNGVEVGDTIEIVRVSNDRSPYLRNGIFVSIGNFIFDALLLAAELGIAIAMIITLLRNRKQTAGTTVQ